MAIKPVSDWTSSYEDLFYKQEKTADSVKKLWGDWVHKNTLGLESLPPYKTKANLNRDLFPDLSQPPSPSCVPFARKLANAWSAYIGGAMWEIPPPVNPPWTAITTISPSGTGIIAAKEELFATLITIMSSVPSGNESQIQSMLKQKANLYANAFYKATLASGFMLVGTGIGAPPPPLVLPLLPVK